MRLLVFLQGTALMRAGAVGVSRARRVQQVRRRHPIVMLEFGGFGHLPDSLRDLATVE